MRLAHDPGGRVAIPLPDGMRGGASYCLEDGTAADEDAAYRPTLWRTWGKEARLGLRGGPYDFALFLGANPSTARADVNDPTICKDIKFTRRLLALEGLVKVNVADYRATSPKRLLVPGVQPRSAINLNTIRGLAADAQCVIVCHGQLAGKIADYARETVYWLKRDGRQMHALALMTDGTPRHPLYLPDDSSLVEYRP